MSATQATVTSTPVAVRCRRNVGSLSIDMSTDTRPIYRSRCVGQHSVRHLDRHIGRESVDMSTDISVEHRSMCRPTGDRSVGRDVDRRIGRGVRKLHMILYLLTGYLLPFCSSYQASTKRGK